ncbi:MAG: hypothetical protein IAG10_11500 [Planctomycetaceae bacterium]|nr:hypothetical protein [Planctomycetaceae bacterium]
MRNTPFVVIGILLVVLGTAAFFSRELIDRQRETVVKVGPLSVTADTDKSVPLSPILGGIGVVCGAVLIAVGARKI